MVLLNGIKYACERCIRGHRVSACTHTDKTLVMIKPKGRPASQCTHCREQRKIKNAHTLCHCGKKGKSPGQHLASCLCHKNSHCTCVAKDKKPPVAPRKPPSPDVAALDSGDASHSEASQLQSDFLRGPAGAASKHDLDFLIEDIALPFETNQGLLDYFSSLDQFPSGTPEHAPAEPLAGPPVAPAHMLHAQPGPGPPNPPPPNAPYHGFGEAFPAGLAGAALPRRPPPPQDRDTAYFPHSPSDTDLDLMENMFPLFPLVGFNSFEHDRSLPLLGLPEGSNHLDPSRGPDPHRTGTHGVSLPYSVLASTFKTDGPHTSLSRNRSGSSQPINSSIQTSLQSTHPSSASLTNINSGATHHPRPLKPSSSFTVGYQSSRPKRSESVMSAASTSSNTSKQNLFESSQISQHNFPKAQTSAAYPPFNLDNNSTDDFQTASYNSPGLYNENRLLPILSDEEAPRNWQFSGNVTPQSSMPSRQVLQTRRKASLSRSHLQLHHNSMSKDHALYSVKAGSSVENSPQKILEKRFIGYDDTAAKRTPELDSYLREVTEESTAFPPRDNVSVAQTALFPQLNDDFNIEDPDFSLIPMYQELFETTQPLQNGL
ncbi:hypothetical protein METBIDRAFT_13328 [Metschnikowia bicuspidata var. bicuspidata NRRL YB-4993]|uniref:Copper-fist domain-containing protein n=1 Tax=Metschnikowia bicuspidata var. bicuspidata NRRL YB-4993 TaxID=869754 RepID=A0A1A0H6P0_9ASCO|nr:hypothetical protein METBIDRAFT_13328 [Metschnikowia bicuspidata var. bicuspidata NRRL YB-4993]OBA19578.1 hypothetical protein METBIDRAFT_13328 [Metschnikowia bicuspidata var. bicuspidata NRRL YB-4993]